MFFLISIDKFNVGNDLPLEITRIKHASTQPCPVVIPDDLTILEYDCAYMNAICLNAKRWLSSVDGQSRTFATLETLNNFLFGYDPNTAAKELRG